MLKIKSDKEEDNQISITIKQAYELSKWYLYDATHKAPESGIWVPILERFGVYTNNEKDHVFEDKTEKPKDLRIFHRVMVHSMSLGQFWNPDKSF